MVVRSLLGTLIAAQQSTNTTSTRNTPTAQSANNFTDQVGKRPNRRPIVQNSIEEKNDRKPAAKRKRRVNVDPDEEEEEEEDENRYYNNNNSENDGDDDSLYRDHELIKEEMVDRQVDSLTDNDSLDEQEDPQEVSSSLLDFHEKYAKALHVLYGPPHGPSSASVAPPSDDYLQTLQETLVPPVPPIMQIRTTTELLQPRPKRLRNRQTKTWTTVLETPTEAQQRVDRRRRNLERINISHRWKVRVVDFRNEPDVGGAIYHRAKRHLQDKVWKEVREQQKQQQDEALAAQQLKNIEEQQDGGSNQEHSDLLQDEDSVQEQQGVLDRLTQQSANDDETDVNVSTAATVASTNYASADETIADWSDYSVPYKDRMDYWNYGYSCPRNVEYPTHNTSVRPQIPLSTIGQQLTDPDPHGLRLPRRPQLYNPEGQDEWQPSYFPPSNSARNPRFFQYGLLQALVTRHLCGRGTKNEALQERLLRLLFSPTHHEGEPLAKFARTRTYLKMAGQLGCNALLYTQHTWSNPEAVARELGLLGNNALAGQSQNPKSLHNLMKNLRVSVLRKYRLKKIPWNHQSHNDPKQKNTALEAAEKEQPDHPSSSLDSRDHVGSSPREGAVQQSSIENLLDTRRAHEESQIESLPSQTMSHESSRASKRIVVEHKMRRRSQATMEQGPGIPRVDPLLGDETIWERTLIQRNIMEGPEPDDTNKYAHTSVDEIDRGADNDVGHVKDSPSISNKDPNQSISRFDFDKETTLEATSQGGVIIDVGTLPSENSSKKSPPSFGDSPSQIAIEEAKLFPTSTFAHIPGTSPQVPSFPLDPTGIVYGPIDRYARYNHQENYVHHGHFQLAFSTLLSRVIQSDHEQHRQTIQSLLNEYIELTDNKGYKRYFQQTHGKIRDVPLVQFYQALSTACTFLVNGCPSLRRQNQSTLKQEEDYANMEDPSGVDATRRDQLDSREVAEQLFKLLEHRIQHNGLLRFPRLKAIFALATMARKLPVGAANILSRPINEEECPLHIVRECVEYLEQHSLIRGGRDTAGYFDAHDESIQYGELEYIFYDASERFETCMKADPMNIDFYAWRVGTLAVSFLLCSGNRIGGSGAVRFPSTWKRQAFERMGNDRVDSYLDHEVREKLPKFEEVALHLTAAIQTLFTLIRYQPGAKAHLAIVSLLEWHQVIALLAGDALERHTENIKSLYQHHKVQRFYQEYSPSAREGMYTLSKSVGFYAMELENNPGDIDCWRALVNALGSLGTKCATSVDTAHRDTCLHCPLVRQGRRVDHEYTESLGCNWWGHGRDWWLSSMLFIPKDPNQRRNQSTAEPVLCHLEESSQELPDEKSDMTKDPNVSASNALLGWLPKKSELQKRRKTIPSKKERATSFHNALPPFTSVDNQTSDICTIAGKVSPTVEILVYKIFIFCHLKGPGDPVVYDRIYSLIRESWDYKSECVKSDSGTFQGVLWLYNAGIDVPTICRRNYPKYSRQPLKKSYVAKRVK